MTPDITAPEPTVPDGPGTVKDQILTAYRAQNAAMIAADTDTLEVLLDDQYLAVHIGGYQQPKQEWLDQIRLNRMAYHAITEQSAVVTVQGDLATLDATALVDATIFGSRATWRIRSSTTYTHTGGRWKAIKSTATTY
jgi:hypothetical protein